MTQRTESRPSWNAERHSALFQRVNGSAHYSESTRAAVEPARPREPVTASARELNIYTELMSHLRFHPTDLRHHDDVRHATPSLTRAVDCLEAQGFTRDEILECGFGLYPAGDEVHNFLRRRGFSDTAIRESGLVSVNRHEDWHGCLLCPVFDLDGQMVDIVAWSPVNSTAVPEIFHWARGPHASGVSVIGLNSPYTSRPLTSLPADIVIVEDPAEALLLQSRGINGVCAIAGDGNELSPQRWQELARLGVRSVTLAFRRTHNWRRDVRDALENALHARTAPEVFVIDHELLAEHESPADVVKQHGTKACERLLDSRSRAYFGKDFGWSSEPRREFTAKPAPVREPKPTREPASRWDWSFGRDWSNREDVVRSRWATWRAELEQDIEHLATADERAAMWDLVRDVDDALSRGHYRLARELVESRLSGRVTHEPASQWRSQAVTGVLDKLTIDGRAPRMADELSSLVGRDEQAGSVKVLAAADRNSRFQELCARVVHTINHAGHAVVVVCREFTEDEITLGVIAQQVQALTDGPGHSLAAIQTRLSGHDPREGYQDKPWLIDEAVDRLRQAGTRVQFINEGERTVGTTFWHGWPADMAARCVIFDHPPQHGWTGRTRQLTDDLSDFAKDQNCVVVVFADTVYADAVQPTFANRSWGSRREQPVAMPKLREIYSHLHAWIDREEGVTPTAYLR